MGVTTPVTWVRFTLTLKAKGPESGVVPDVHASGMGSAKALCVGSSPALVMVSESVTDSWYWSTIPLPGYVMSCRLAT